MWFAVSLADNLEPSEASLIPTVHVAASCGHFLFFWQCLYAFYLCLRRVDVVAPLLAEGYLLGILFARGVAFGDFGRDVVRRCQAAFAVKNDALLLVDELLFLLLVHFLFNFN